MDDLESWLAATEQVPHPGDRPRVSLCYAQSLDGSLAVQRGQPLALSGVETMRLTHRLRAAHDAILVGIGTVLADDPQLNVRYATGPSPQPVILDNDLRFPLTARLWESNPHRPWLATQAPLDEPRRAALEGRGARLIQLPSGPPSQALPALLRRLWDLGIRSLMVEGGARVIESFLRGDLVDRLVITVAPRLVGGLRSLGESGPLAPPLALGQVRYERLGDDLVVCALPARAPGD